jgi:PAS domain S-box-containing protein
MTPPTPAPAALDLLLTLTTAIGRAATIREIYEASLDAIQQGLGVRRASILLFDSDGVMRFAAWRGLTDDYRRAVEGHSPWKPGTREAAPIAISDVNADPALAPYLGPIRAEGISAMALVPLLTDGGVTGKFVLYYDASHVPSAIELQLASVIAAQVAFAVQRVRAEEKGRAREMQLRLVTDAAPVAIAHCDRHGRYKFVNRAYAARFGLGTQDVVGRTMSDVLGTRAANSVQTYVEAALRGEAVDAEVEVPYDVLGPRMIHLRYEPEFDADGAVCGLAAVVLDVTEQYRTAVLKRYADDYLRALIETTPECVKVVAADGTLLEMNAAGLEMVEAPSAEAVAGRCVYDLIAPEHRGAFRAFNERICRGARGSLEFDIIGLAGTRRTMETTAVPLTARDGSVHHLAITREITHRRQAEAALVQSEAMFRQLTETLPQIIWTTGADGQPSYFNPRWYDFTGLPPGSLERNAGRECIHPEDRQPALDAWARALATGAPYQVELRLRDSRTRAYRWHLARSVPVRDDNGKVLRWIGSATDIDDQKRAERTSRFIAAASRTLATLVDYQTALQRVAELAVPDFADWCAVDIAADDGRLRRLALCHADPDKVHLAFELERRYPPRQNSNRGAQHVLKTGQPEMMTEIPDSLIEQVAYDAAHLAAIRTLGLRSYVSVPLVGAGRTIGVITFIATDDSGRRYDEHDLAVAQELAYRAGIAIENARLYSDLQQADRHKDEFLAVLAHELRNPLAPLRTALQLIEVAGDDAVRRNRASTVMDRQLRHMVRLVDDLLDVSRITRGRIELQKQPIELAAILQNAIETSRPMIEGNGHQLTVTFPPDPLVVNADPTRIAQVFSNLLNNAAKYTPRGGHITLAAEADGANATIRVRDSGIGIPREMLARVFEMFVQVDRSFERSSGGLGIGLTLVKRLVEMHGGAVDAHSDGPGTGTEFVVRLPTVGIDTRLEAEDRARAGMRPRNASRRILVADDNVDAAECLADALRLMGHEVRAVHDGMSAVEVTNEHQPELVFLDLGMPKVDGYEAARRIRAALGQHVFIVAVTGWGQEEDLRRSQNAGFDRHLIKPVDISEVATLIDAWPARSSI